MAIINFYAEFIHKWRIKRIKSQDFAVWVFSHARSQTAVKPPPPTTTWQILLLPFAFVFWIFPVNQCLQPEWLYFMFCKLAERLSSGILFLPFFILPHMTCPLGPIQCVLSNGSRSVYLNAQTKRFTVYPHWIWTCSQSLYTTQQDVMVYSSNTFCVNDTEQRFWVNDINVSPQPF